MASSDLNIFGDLGFSITTEKIKYSKCGLKTKKRARGGGECPVVAEIQRIGGHYDEENIVPRVIGGRQYVFDDSNLFFDQLAFTVARLELRKPPIEKLKLHWRIVIEPLLAFGTRAGLIQYILSSESGIGALISQGASDLVGAASQLNTRLILAAYAAARDGKCLDMKLPYLPPILPNPTSSPVDIIMDVVKWCSSLDISCVAKMPPAFQAPSATPAPPPTPEAVLQIEKPTGEITIEKMREVVDKISEAREEVTKYEAYLIDVAAIADDALRFIRGIRFLY